MLNERHAEGDKWPVGRTWYSGGLPIHVGATSGGFSSHLILMRRYGESVIAALLSWPVTVLHALARPQFQSTFALRGG